MHKVCFIQGFERAIELTRSLYLSDDLKSNMLKIDSLPKIQHSIISEIEKPVKIEVEIETDISAGKVYEVKEILKDENDCLILKKIK